MDSTWVKLWFDDMGNGKESLGGWSIWNLALLGKAFS